MSASLGLYRLQQIDSQIDRLNTRIAGIHKILANDKELSVAKTKFEEVQKSQTLALQKMHTAEAEAHGLKLKIEQTEATLYSGNVKSPKELQDLQFEINSLKKHLITLEERELEAMLGSEQISNEFELAATELERIQARLGNEHKLLISEETSLAPQMERLSQERIAAIAPIEAALLEVYETLRVQKRGIAVTQVDDGACSSCGGTINASLQQNARSQKLAYCPSCSRILFAN